jgi:hypothetical protein
MSWKRIRERKGKTYFYSIANKLRREGKSNEDFEIMLASLPLEDIIALKLELASKPVNNRLYGLKLWQALPYIARDAAVKFVFSASRSQKEAMRFLGMRNSEFSKMKWRYDPISYFTENDKKDI